MKTLLFTTLCLLLFSHVQGVTYTLTGPGNWTNTGLWSPSYPGTSIHAGDYVYISGAITLNTDLVNLNGVITINAGASLTGSTFAIQTLSGNFINNGTVSVASIDNLSGHGLVNNNSFTAASDIDMNGGSITNTGTLNADNILVTPGSFNNDGGSVYLTGDLTLISNSPVDNGSIRTYNDGYMAIGGSLSVDALSAADISSYITIGEHLTNHGNIVSLENAGGINICASSGVTENQLNNTGTINIPEPICMCSSNTTNTVNNSGTITNGLDNSCDSQLPVELGQFTAEKNALGIQLSWTTFSERNNDHFMIEYATDGKSFDQIGKITGLGNSTQTHHYQFIVEGQLASRAYFRLKQVDFDGKYSYSKVISLQQDNSWNFQVNHDAEFLTIKFPTETNIYHTKLVNTQGKEILLEAVGQQAKLPPYLSTGIYFVFVESDQGFFKRKIYLNY